MPNYLLQPTLRREGEARLNGASSKKGRRAEVATNVYSRKTKKGSVDFKEKGSRVVYTRGRY